MPANVPKDKLTEKEDQPPSNDPHHRTTRPRRSVLKLGSDAGIDPLPVVSKSPTRPVHSRPGRAHSPRPEIRRSSTSRAVRQPGFEKASRGPRRALSQDVSRRGRAPELVLERQRGVRSISRERSAHRSYRRTSNISQIQTYPVHGQIYGPPVMAAPMTISPYFNSHSSSTWPEIIHIPPVQPLAAPSLSAANEEHVRQRRHYLQHYKQILQIDALHALLSEQVAPLNPVLAVPPPSYRLFGIGNWLERRLENSNWMLNRRAKKNALPGLVWDVRTSPEAAAISAWPYTTMARGVNGEFPRKKEMRTRGLVDEMEVRRFYGQTVTNPPSSFVVIRMTENWSIRVRSNMPGRWVCVRDVIEAVYNSLSEPLTPIGTISSIRSVEVTTVDTETGPPVTRLSTLKGGRYVWVGLRREMNELVAGAAVGVLPNGEIDGGTWWLVLRKP